MLNFNKHLLKLNGLFGSFLSFLCKKWSCPASVLCWGKVANCG